MNKLIKSFALLCATIFISYGFVSCSADDDDAGEESESTSIEKGKEFSEKISIDLNGSLNTDGLSAFDKGTDITNYFVASQASSARSAVSDGSGLESFKATVESVTSSKIEVLLTAKAPETDCKIVLCVAIPADFTESGEDIVQNSAVLDVGDVKEISNKFTVLSSFTKITNLSDVSGKIFKYYFGKVADYELEVADVYYYYSFTSDSVTCTEYVCKTSTGELVDGSPETAARIFKKNGKLYDGKQINNTENYNYDKDERAAYDGTLYLKNGIYYIIDENAFQGKSGNGLFTTFSEDRTIRESTSEKFEQTESLTLHSDGSVSGSSTSGAYIVENGTETPVDVSTSNYTGTFTNNGGILSCDLKVVGISTAHDETYAWTSTVASNFLYDGSNLYFMKTLEAVSSLPED